MNLVQFLSRWPAKEGRLFLLASGKDADRLPIFYRVADHWCAKVDRMDVSRIHECSLPTVAEACRRDPVVSRYRVVIATEVRWEDPAATESNEEKTARLKTMEPLLRLVEDFPRDLVLIMSTAADNPKTDNPLAQLIIRKGYWVVLRNTDEQTARELLRYLTGWEDEELISDFILSSGTSPAAILSELRTIRIAYDSPTSDQIRQYLSDRASGGVFELVDAVIDRDLARALSLPLDDIPPGQFLGALDRKFTSLVQFSAELRRGRSPKEAALNLRLPGFIVHGLYEAQKRWDPREILSLWPSIAAHTRVMHQPGATEMFITQLIDA